MSLQKANAWVDANFPTLSHYDNTDILRNSLKDAYLAGLSEGRTEVQPLQIPSLITACYDNFRGKGFWDKPKNIGEALMLIVSELAEALEADREDRRGGSFPIFEEYLQTYELETWEYLQLRKEGKVNFDEQSEGNVLHFREQWFSKYIRGSFEEEIADTAIRLFDLCGGLQINLEYFIVEKMKYNSTRQAMHGKKY